MFTTLRHVFHLARAGYVLVREGVFATIDPAFLPPPARLPLLVARLLARRSHAGAAERIAAALQRLGPSYVKFGQFLATRPDVVGTRLARDLEKLQDRMPSFSQIIAVKVVEATFEKPLDSIFESFSVPVAAASIAQVHKARIVGDAAGEEVAVKILRPNVQRLFKRDLDLFYFAARAAERFLPAAQRLRPVEIVDVLARSVAMEMDLRLEAAALSEMAENTRNDSGFIVPQPNWELTGRDVLTMQWIDGIPLSDLAGLRAAGLDLPALGRSVIQSFLRQALRDGFFHADMHQGNLFANRAGELVAVDFGIMGRIGPKERRFLAEILLGFITRDYHRVAEVHFEAGYVPARHSVEDFAQAIRAIGEPIHQKTADQISMAKLLTLLFEITELFDMKTRPELVMLQKTMVVVEGVARTLDTRLDMWSTAEPVVREWIERNLGPLGRLQETGGDLLAISRHALKLPALLERGERVMRNLEAASNDGFQLSAGSIEALGRAEARRARWSNLALWLIAFALITIAWRLI